MNEEIIDCQLTFTLSKSYAGMLIDRRFDTIKKQEEATAYLMNCLRYRMDIRLDDCNNNSQPIQTNERQSIQSLRIKKSPHPANEFQASLYDTLLDLLKEFDASGRAEIFRLLLERRSAIPLFLPSGEHHLPMLRLLNKTVKSSQTICIGADVTLLRLAVISCRKKKDSKMNELLKEVFHFNSLHRDDFSRRFVTRESVAAELGLGCVLPLAENRDPVHLLVLNVVGDFDLLWDFIKAYSDYIIIEDATNEEERFYRRPQFSNYKGAATFMGLEGIKSVLVWKPSLDALVADYHEGSDHPFGFEHLEDTLEDDHT